MSTDLFGHPIAGTSRYSWSVRCGTATLSGEEQTLEAAQMSAQEAFRTNHGAQAMITGPSDRLFELVQPPGNPRLVWMLK